MRVWKISFNSRVPSSGSSPRYSIRKGVTVKPATETFRSAGKSPTRMRRYEGAAIGGPRR
jgi:hypothetical protein